MTIKRVLAGVATSFLLCAPALSQYVQIAGSLQSSNGLPASNYGITFTPSQFGFIAGTGVVVNTTTACATSVDGSVVGLPNPLTAPPVTVGFTGTLPPANYYVKIAFYDASGNLTLVSPETVIQLNSIGRLLVASPVSGLPAGAVGMKVYISASTNTETLQGQTTGSAAFIQQTSLAAGAAIPAANTTLCKQVANDSIWPVGTGYTVALIDPSGNTLPGYPMQWQLMGAGSTINLSQGLPYYNGTVVFPSPILASPLNHSLQSISGPVSFGGYNLSNVGAIGFGTSLPAWPIDVENGAINASGGFLFNGAAPSGHFLVGNGTAYVDAATIPAGSITGTLYQTIASNGTAQTQRPTLNFTPRFALTDSSAPAETTVDLAAAGTPGTYAYPASITVDAYGRVGSVTAGTLPAPNVTQSDVSTSRTFGTVYQNTSTAALYVSGNGNSNTGSSTGTLACMTGPTATPGVRVWQTEATATVAGAPVGFACMVPAGYYYEITAAGDVGYGASGKWIEDVF